MYFTLEKVSNMNRFFYRSLLAIFMTLVYFMAYGQSGTDRQVWHLSNTSQIIIEGSSNVNQFQCQKQTYKGNDYLTEGSKNGQKVLSGHISLSVSAFECDNSTMTRDFMHTLKSDLHPKIRFEMHELVFSGCSNKTAIGSGIIRIAGESRAIRLHWTIDESKPGEIRLTASKNLKFTTFNLTPPRKMMGLIQVHDDITVHFHLVLRQK